LLLKEHIIVVYIKKSYRTVHLIVHKSLGYQKLSSQKFTTITQ